jgi:hypothetical protein
VKRTPGVAVCALSLAVSLALTTDVLAATVIQTRSLEFVMEYIRELAELESIRASGEAELKQNANSLSSSMYVSSRIQLALRTDIGMLSSMNVGGQLKDLPRQIASFHQQKIDIHERLKAISTEFMSGPKPGVEYGKLVSEVPQLRAQLDSIDEFFLKISAMVFATLIDEKPDGNGHMSRLTITSAERQELLKLLQDSFGSKLDKKEQKYLIGAAEVLRSYLRKEKGFKTSDEPM